MGLNFQVPDRGIYGNISGLFSFLLVSNNSRPGGIGGVTLALNMSVALPQVKFHVNVTSELLPQEPEYLLTDYLEGNVSVEFLNIDDNLELDFPGRNITSNINIPLDDLGFRIILDDLNKTPALIDIAQSLHFTVLGQTIIWLDQIDPHLIPGFYRLKIRWETPFVLNITDQAFVAISDVTFEVKGSLRVLWGTPNFEIEKGDQITINFTVLLEDNAKVLGGLDLVGIVESNTSLGNVVVYEDSGVYKIDLETDFEMIAGNYSIVIRIGNRELPSPITFKVIAQSGPPTSGDTLIDLVIGIAGFGFFVLVSIVIVGVMFRVNRSIQ
jgi:hypothetical protein